MELGSLSETATSLPGGAWAVSSLVALQMQLICVLMARRTPPVPVLCDSAHTW